MTLNRKILGAAAFSLALAAGGAAGAVLGTPALSGAQDGADEPPESGADGALRQRGHKGEALATAAEALGVSEDDLRAALQDGSSIADVAEEQGVELQVVIDALVAAATERLEEVEAALPERMTELVNRTGWGEHRRPGRGLRHLGLASAAEAIGVTVEGLRSELASGATIAEVAEANDVAVQDVIDAMVGDASAKIDDAVAAGRIDEDRAAELKAALEERITAAVNGEGPRGDRAGDSSSDRAA